MSPSKRLYRWTVSAALVGMAAIVGMAAVVSLFAAGPIAAAQGEPGGDSQGSPPPQIDSYQPFPAAWDEPITIHGSNLVPWQDPSISAQAQPVVSGSTFQKAVEVLQPKHVIVSEPSGPSEPAAPVPEGPNPVLKVGSAGNKPGFVIPASDIESWTSTEIQIKKLSGGRAGAYWIAVYQNGERVSNLNRTLLFPETDPNAVHTLAPLDPSDSEEDEEVMLSVSYPLVEEPSQPAAYVASYQPTVVGAGDEVAIFGWFGVQGNRRLFVGTGNQPLGKIEAQWIKEWSSNKIRFENGFLPTGVYWVAVFEGLDLISNLVWSLQVTADPPPSPPSGNGPGQIITGLGNLPLQNVGESNLDAADRSGLQRMPVAPRTGFPVKIPSPQPRMQPAPRAKIIQPSAESLRSPGGASEREALEAMKQRQPASDTTTAPPIAPVPEKTPDRTLRPIEKQPRIQRQ